ncbi:MAG: LutC/YkgG family protein [Desulfohalobiaceae bacterium]
MKTAARKKILQALRFGTIGLKSPGPVRKGDLGLSEKPGATEAMEQLGREIETVGGVYAAVSSVEQLRQAVLDLVRGQDIAAAVCWDHASLGTYGLKEILAQAGVQVLENPEPGEEYCAMAARADLGVTGCLAAVVESGTVVVAAGPGMERSTSLLPPVHLAVVSPETTLLPRIADLGVWVDGLASQGLPSAVHCISGPSSTADIELVKVVGVHGPVTLFVLAVMPEA